MFLLSRYILHVTLCQIDMMVKWLCCLNPVLLGLQELELLQALEEQKARADNLASQLAAAKLSNGLSNGCGPSLSPVRA